jgi:Zn-dependent M28 family amino/carboxypeptidase
MSILVISAPGPFPGEQLVGTDAVGVVVGDGRDDQLVGLGGVAETARTWQRRPPRRRQRREDPAEQGADSPERRFADSGGVS